MRKENMLNTPKHWIAWSHLKAPRCACQLHFLHVRLSVCATQLGMLIRSLLRYVNQCYVTWILECKRRKQLSQKLFSMGKRRDERRRGVLKSRIEGCVCFSWGVTVKRFNWICEGEVWNMFLRAVAIAESNQNICCVISWIWRFTKRKQRHNCLSENEKFCLWPGHQLLIHFILAKP